MNQDNLLNREMIDMNVTIDLPVRVYWERYGSPEYWKKLEKELEYEIRDFQDFIHDHRSRDSYGMQINKIYAMHCKFCGYEYPDGYNGLVDCCGEALDAQEEYIKSLQKEE